MMQAGWVNNLRIFGTTFDFGLIVVMIISFLYPGTSFRWLAVIAIIGEIMGSGWIGQYTLMLVGAWLVIYYLTPLLRHSLGQWSFLVIAIGVLILAQFWGSLTSGALPNWSLAAGFSLNLLFGAIFMVITWSFGKHHGAYE